MARKSKLTTKLIDQVCEKIKAGAYDYIAAEAAGISQRTFYDWLADAEKPDAAPLKIQFSQSVAQARAEARQAAEQAVMKDKPETWLLKGPGREKPGRPGWTNESTVNAEITGAGGGAVVLTLQEWRKQAEKNHQQVAQVLSDFEDE